MHIVTSFDVSSPLQNSLRMREKLLMESYKRIESNLKLLGATGIEDKLQEGVPNVIENLRQAGIVLCVYFGLFSAHCWCQYF